jgi:hypothetical protein
MTAGGGSAPPAGGGAPHAEEAEEAPAPPDWAALPPDVAAAALSHLRVADLLAAAATCRAWRAATADEALWERLHAAGWRRRGAYAPWDALAAAGRWRELVIARARADATAGAAVRAVEGRGGELVAALAGRPLPPAKALARAVELGFDNVTDALVRVAEGAGARCALLEPRAGPSAYGPERLQQSRSAAALFRFLAVRALRPRALALAGPAAIEEGALLISRVVRGPFAADLADVPADLDRWAAAARRLVPPPAGARAVLAALRTALFAPPPAGAGLRGAAAEEYYDPVNSLLDAALRRRRGLPLTLGIAHAAVARRLGLAVQILGTPGHVLNYLRLPDGAEVFIDCHDGGLEMGRGEANAFFAARGHFMWAIPDPPPALTPPNVWRRVMANIDAAMRHEPRLATAMSYDEGFAAALFLRAGGGA